MIDLLKTIYHKLSGIFFVRWMGKMYLNGSVWGNFMAYRRLRRVVRKEKSNRKIIVVFIVQNRTGWSVDQPIYEACKADNRFCTYLIAIPDITDQERCETYYFLKAQYEDVIDIYETGELFEMEVLHPDYVFYPRSYDQYLPRRYHTDIVSSYAKICYCPYCFTMSKEVLDDVYNKRFFRNVYLYFAETPFFQVYNENRFPISHDKGIRKSISIGYPKIEKYVKMRAEKQSLRPHNILWTPRWTTSTEVGGSNFFLYKDKIIDYAMENENCHVTFRPHPLAFYNLIKTGKMTKEEIDKYRKVYIEEDRLSLDEKTDYLQTFRDTDILVSDASSMVLEFLATKKPIIVCDIGVTWNGFMDQAVSGCYITHSWEETVAVLNELLNGQDKLKEIREKISEKLFGEDVNNISQHFLDYIANDFEN